LLNVVKRYSRDARIFDMAAVAQETGTVLSAVLFGAISGSGALPFPREAFEQTIRKSGKGVDASVRGFARACEIVSQGLAAPTPVPLKPRAAADMPAELSRAFPAATHEMLAAGYARMLEYQDHDYAQHYVQRLTRILAAERVVDPVGLEICDHQRNGALPGVVDGFRRHRARGRSEVPRQQICAGAHGGQGRAG
jgi:indolepyruvate ferredoxin oxidoreductase beta subunit